MSRSADTPSAEQVIEANRELFESLAEGDDGVAAAAEQLLAEVGDE